MGTVQPPAVWQKIQKYPLHWTTGELTLNLEYCENLDWVFFLLWHLTWCGLERFLLSSKETSTLYCFYCDIDLRFLICSNTFPFNVSYKGSHFYYVSIITQTAS